MKIEYYAIILSNNFLYRGDSDQYSLIRNCQENDTIFNNIIKGSITLRHANLAISKTSDLQMYRLDKDRFDFVRGLNILTVSKEIYLDRDNAEKLIKNYCEHYNITYNIPAEQSLDQVCSCGKECKPTDEGECYDCWNKKHMEKFR